MKDEIIIRTLMDTEIGVLEEFVKKVEDSPKVLEDDKFVSRANFDILKGHLGTLKKLRETSWRAIKMDEVHDRNHTTITLSNGEQVHMDIPKDMVDATVLKTENYPGQFENLVKERDNWREMYDQELKKNEELSHRILLTNYDRDCKVKKFERENEELEKENEKLYTENENLKKIDIERLKKENDELSRINFARGDEIDRLRQRGTCLELDIEDLERRLTTLRKENDDLKCKVTELENRIINIKNENSELSRINSARLGDISRLLNKVDKLDGYLHSIDDAYSEIPVNKLRPGYYDGMVKFCNDVFDILYDWKKS